MAGHISYPRTIAAENAWLNYRHAVDLANCGATDASISILQKIINDLSAPTHLKELATQLFRTLLANTGNFSSKKSLTENILEVSAGQPVAATTKICSERMKKLLQEDVEKALKSSDPDKALEGQVGKMVIKMCIRDRSTVYQSYLALIILIQIIREILPTVWPIYY